MSSPHARTAVRGLGSPGNVSANPIPNPIPEPISEDAQQRNFPKPDQQHNSPKRGRGRPVGSFKVKHKTFKPVVLIDGQPRRPGRPAAKATLHQNDQSEVASASGARCNQGRSAEDADSLPLNHSRAHQPPNFLPAPQNAEAPPRPDQDAACTQVTCTHDFSIISLHEMQRLAAACVASAMRKSSEDPRFAAHSASLRAITAELEARALDSGL